MRMLVSNVSVTRLSVLRLDRLSFLSLALIRDYPRKSAVQGFANCQLPAASLPRINTDFSSHFHIRKNRKSCAAPAWILNFTNLLH